MSFDVEGALKAGYSQEDINTYLADKTDFDLAGAMGAGYNSQEVLKYLTDKLSADSPLRDLIPSITAPTPRAPRAPAVDIGPTDAELAAIREQINTDADSGFLRQTLDLPVQLGKGVATGTRFITDVFGADNPVSQKISGVEDFLDGLLSAQAKQDQQEVSRIMQEAEDKGLKDQVVAGLQAFAVAPLDLITNAFGTSAPTLIAGLLAPGGAAALTGRALTAAQQARVGAGVATGVGTLTGVGITKDAAYNAVYEELLNAGVDDVNAKEAAAEAQAYSGENIDNIAFGGFLGALAARFGLEGAVFGRNVTSKIAAPSMATSIASTAIKEAIPEAMQGGQEQFTRNIALQREGFDVPAERGVIGAATLEGTVGVPIGALAGYGTGRTERKNVQATDALAARFTGESAEEIEILNLDELSEEDQNRIMEEYGNEENKRLVDSVEKLTPGEQADIDAGKKVTRKNYVRFGKYFVPQEIADGSNLTEEDLSERIDRQTEARNKMNLLGENIARATQLVTELERINNIKTPARKTKALRDRNLTEEQLAIELQAAQAQAASLNDLAMKIEGRESQDISAREAQVAQLEAESEAYAQASRSIKKFNATNTAKINKLRRTPAKDLTRQEQIARRFFSKRGLPKDAREVTLLNIAADIAQSDVITEEIKQSREQQPNIPSDELIDRAANELVVEKRQGMLSPKRQREAVLARQWVEDNLSGTPATQLNEIIDALKTERKQAILSGARAKNLAAQKTTTRPLTKKPMREGTPTGPRTPVTIPTSPPEATTVEEAEAEALQKMGLKKQPRSEARKKEYNKLKRAAIATREGEFAQTQQTITSKDIAAQIERQGITFPQDIPNEVREFAEKGNLKQTINNLLKDEPSEIQFLLRSLARMAANTKIRIAPVPDSPTGGMFNEGTNEIVLDPDRGLNKQILFHELGHAALSRRLDNPNSKEAKEFFEFFSEIKDQMGDAYGGTDLHEFVSEFLGQTQEGINFRALLKDIKAPNSENFFTRIINAILNLLGINKDKQTPTAYDKAFKFIEDIVNLGSESDAPPLERIFYASENPDKVIPDVFEDTIPPFNKTKVARTLDKIKGSRRLFRAGLKFLRMDNFEELYGKYLPAIKNIIKFVEERQAYQENKTEEAQLTHRALVVLEKRFPKEMEKLGKLANLIRIAEVDILSKNDNKVETPKGNPEFIKEYQQGIDRQTGKRPTKQQIEQKLKDIEKLQKEFNRLPTEIQQAYKALRVDYDSMFNDFVDFSTASIPDKDLRDKITKDFMAKKPAAGYIPQRRFGDFILQFTDKNGVYQVVSFESYVDRNEAIKGLGLTESLSVNPESGQQTRLDPDNPQQYIVTNSIEESLQQSGPPPSHFVAQLFDAIDSNAVDQGIDVTDPKQKQILDNQKKVIYEAYLDLLPENSLVRQFRPAKNNIVAGASIDLPRVYGETMVRFARKMGNTKYNEQIRNAFSEVRKQAATYERDPKDADPLDIIEVASEIAEREGFTINPEYSSPIRLAATGSFTLFLAGNISSAAINLTSIPLLGQPILNKYFGGKEIGVLLDSMKLAVNDDWGTNKDSNYKELYDFLMKRAALRHTTNREIMEGSRQSTQEFNTLTAKVMNLLSLPFSATEKYNRATMGIAAYKLAKANPDRVPPEYRSEEGAKEFALKIIKDVNTSGMAATGPRLMQGDYAGGIGRATFTFKSFIWQSAFVTARAFHQSIKGETPEVRRAAFRQFMFINGMSFSIAGAFGMPFFGAFATLTNMVAALVNTLDDEEEEPFNTRREMMLMFPEWVTKGPTNYLTNIEISNRASVANGLLFREDPYEIEKFGYVGAAMMQAFGPIGNFARNVPYGMRLIAEGKVARGVEQFSPSFFRNALKTFRYMDEGVVTSQGIPIKEDLNGWLLAKQFLGFSPADLSTLYETRALAKQYEAQVMERRRSLLESRFMAITSGDRNLLRETDKRIREFRRIYPRLFNRRTLESSFKSRASALREYEYGLRFDKNFRPYLDQYFDRLETQF